MGYCFMTTQKIKSMGTLAAKHHHNFREVEIANADPDLQYRNEELLSYRDKDGNRINYNQAWEDRMQGIKTRKNSVLAIEVITTFSREENINLKKWKEENVRWLEKTFNVAGDGKSNVLSVVYHADEPGNVHCHAIVVPVDEQNRLNASRFLDGRRTLSQMQSDYGKTMKQFGLERGLENGQARHQDIKKYYADLNNAIEVSLPKEQETALEYRDRVLEELQEVQAAAMRERNEKKREMDRKLAEKRIALEKEFEKKKADFDKEKDIFYEKALKQNKSLLQQIGERKAELREYEKSIAAQQQKIDQLEHRYDNTEQKLNDILASLATTKDMEAKIKFYDVFQKQYKLLQERNPERARKFTEELQYMSTLKEQLIQL